MYICDKFVIYGSSCEKTRGKQLYNHLSSDLSFTFIEDADSMSFSII